ncbi:RNA transcription, translation and transport factor protein-like [Choloepus didactylus]|uniref:RNA transcription, translation and transport factor protein-like n=1 Tax=Choloepus didactylus TaxID=27675 RepID=UPI0018A05E30|nr:RNA transcription, translation and transport factor protein-like [Choloepus didactylus]
MFRRKLTALDYHNPAGFNCKDETEFRNFIVWLEDQKIRHYKIEDRGNLRNIHSSDWPKFFEKYLRDVNCPFKIQDRQEAIDWLLGLAVRLEYGDNAEKYKDLVPDNTKNADSATKNAEPLINLDVNNPDFKAGVMALANLLQIQRHDDYLVMLKGLPVALDKHILGFDTGGHQSPLGKSPLGLEAQVGHCKTLSGEFQRTEGHWQDKERGHRQMQLNSLQSNGILILK